MVSGESLRDSQRRRYARHLRLPGFGVPAQHALGASSALVIGAGGLGAPALQYLAASGVGRIGIVDFDTVDVSNLQRQVLFTEADVGRNKAHAAADRVSAANSEIEVEAFARELGPANAEELIRAFDVVVDGSDNFATRYLVNDAGERELGPDLGGVRIPGSMIRDRTDLLPREGAIVLYCDSGGRSRNLAGWFRQYGGWECVYSLSGGSLAWEAREREARE